MDERITYLNERIIPLLDSEMDLESGELKLNVEPNNWAHFEDGNNVKVQYAIAYKKVIEKLKNSLEREIKVLLIKVQTITENKDHVNRNKRGGDGFEEELKYLTSSHDSIKKELDKKVKEFNLLQAVQAFVYDVYDRQFRIIER